jgi:hypothetical protein
MVNGHCGHCEVAHLSTLPVSLLVGTWALCSRFRQPDIDICDQGTCFSLQHWKEYKEYRLARSMSEEQSKTAPLQPPVVSD